MRRRTALAAALAAVLLPGLAACGGSGTSTSGPPPGPVAPLTSSASSGSSGSSASSTGASAGEPSGDPASPYLPVASSITLTAPGTELGLRHAATVAWNPRQGQVGVLKLKVTRIEQTTAKQAFADYSVSDELLRRTPYYVHVKVTNAGDTDVGGRPLPLYADDSADELVEPTGFADRFAPCPDGDLPLLFAPGATTRACLVFLTPADAPLVSVRFQPPVGVDPITWSGTIGTVKDDKPTKGKK